MKPFKLIATVCMTAGLLALSAAEIDGLYIWKNGIYNRFELGDISFNGDAISIADVTINVNDIDSITFVQPEETAVVTDTLYICYDGATATVSPQNVEGITTDINKAAVSIVNANTDREMTFVLSGESNEGSFVYDGEYKTCIRLAGVNLQSSTGAAIHIKCGKRIALELADETANFLSDATEDLGQKAALYCKGHLEVSRGGTLTVKGHVKHAISTKEYMLVKSTTGTITVTGAEGDGIHAGQYFKMNGGTVSVCGTKGDGIQAEATADGDDDDGQIIIKGGILDVTLSERDAAALKSDSLMTISGGKLTITTTGDGDKGLKSKADLNISGGELTFTQSGKYIVEDNDPGYVTSIKADGNLNITGGTIVINNTGEAGKGLSADGDINISEDSATLTLNIEANGFGGTLDLSRNVDSGDDSGGNSGDDEPTPVYRICAALTSSTSQYWKTVVYLYSSDGTKLGQMTKTIKVEASGQTTRTFYCYEFDEPTTGQFYFASDDYRRSGGGGPGGGGGGTTYTIRTSAVAGPTESTPNVYYSINTSSPSTSGTVYTFRVTDYTSRYADGTIVETGSVSPSGGNFVTAAGIKGDKDITISSGTISINSTGAAAKGITCDKVLTTMGGSMTITNSGNGTGTSSSYATAKGMTSDGSIDLQGGNITIQMSGTGGKGIKSDGTLTIGKNDTEGPVLKVTTTGAKYANSSSAKAIKAVGVITVNGGETTVNTGTAGAEGMESKLKSAASIVFKGGKHYFKCYDDCLNTAGCILFDGGVTVCYSNGNDAIDSNYGAAGAITIGNGVVMCYTSKGSPEEGFDCDNNSYIRITGYGIGISGGGNQGGGGGWGGGSSSSSISGAVQGYSLNTSSISYNTNRYYTLADSSGKNLVTYSVEASFSSNLSLFTATGMVKGSSYTLKYSTTKPTDATTEWHGLYLGSSAVGTTQVLSFTAK